MKQGEPFPSPPTRNFKRAVPAADARSCPRCWSSRLPPLSMCPPLGTHSDSASELKRDLRVSPDRPASFTEPRNGSAESLLPLFFNFHLLKSFSVVLQSPGSILSLFLFVSPQHTDAFGICTPRATSTFIRHVRETRSRPVEEAAGGSRRGCRRGSRTRTR